MASDSPKTFKDAIVVKEHLIGQWIDLGFIAEINEDAEDPSYEGKKYLWTVQEINNKNEKIGKSVILKTTENQKLGYHDLLNFILDKTIENKKTYWLYCFLMYSDEKTPIKQANGGDAMNFVAVKLNFSTKILKQTIEKETPYFTSKLEPQIKIIESRTGKPNKTIENAIELMPNSKLIIYSNQNISSRSKELKLSYIWYFSKAGEEEKRVITATSATEISFNTLIKRIQSTGYYDIYAIPETTANNQHIRLTNSKKEPVYDYITVKIPQFEEQNAIPELEEEKEIISPITKTKENQSSSMRINLLQENKFITEIIDELTKTSSKNKKLIEIKDLGSYGFFEKRKTRFVAKITKEAQANKDLRLFWYLEPTIEGHTTNARINIKFSDERELTYETLINLIPERIQNQKQYNLYCEISNIAGEKIKEPNIVFIPIKISLASQPSKEETLPGAEKLEKKEPSIILIDKTTNQQIIDPVNIIELKQDTTIIARLNEVAAKKRRLRFSWELNPTGTTTKTPIAITEKPTLSGEKILNIVKETGTYAILCTLLSEGEVVKNSSGNEINPFIIYDIKELPKQPSETEIKTKKDFQITKLTDLMTKKSPNEFSKAIKIQEINNYKKSQKSKTKIVASLSKDLEKLKNKQFAWELTEINENNEAIDKTEFIITTKEPFINYETILRDTNKNYLKNSHTYSLDCSLVDEEGNLIKNKEGIRVYNSIVIRVFIAEEIGEEDIIEKEHTTTREIPPFPEELIKTEIKSQPTKEESENQYITEIYNNKTKTSSKTVKSPIELTTSRFNFLAPKGKFTLDLTKKALEEKNLLYFWFAIPLDKNGTEISEASKRVVLQYGLKRELEYSVIENNSIMKNQLYNLHCEPAIKGEVAYEKIPLFMPIKLNFTLKSREEVEELKKESKQITPELKPIEETPLILSLKDKKSKTTPKNYYNAVEVDISSKTTYKNRLNKFVVEINKAAKNKKTKIGWALKEITPSMDENMTFEQHMSMTNLINEELNTRDDLYLTHRQLVKESELLEEGRVYRLYVGLMNPKKPDEPLEKDQNYNFITIKIINSLRPKSEPIKEEILPEATKTLSAPAATRPQELAQQERAVIETPQRRIIPENEEIPDYDIITITDKITNKAPPQTYNDALIIKEPENYKTFGIFSNPNTKIEITLSKDAAKLKKENRKFKWAVNEINENNVIVKRIDPIAFLNEPELTYATIKYLVRDSKVLKNNKCYLFECILVDGNDQPIKNKNDKIGVATIALIPSFKPAKIFEKKLETQKQIGQVLVQQAFTPEEEGLTLKLKNNEVKIIPNKRITRIFYDFKNVDILTELGLLPETEVIVQSRIDTRPYEGEVVNLTEVIPVSELVNTPPLQIDSQTSSILFEPNKKYYVTLQLQNQNNGEVTPINVLVLNTGHSTPVRQTSNLEPVQKISQKNIETAIIDIKTLEKQKLSEEKRTALIIEKLSALIPEDYQEWAIKNKIENRKLKEYSTFKRYLKEYYNTTEEPVMVIRAREGLFKLTDKDLKRYFTPILKQFF